MRSCALSIAHAAGARVHLPLPDVPEGIRSAIHGVCKCQARRPALDAREPVDLRELERRRAEFLQWLRHPSDISPRRERQHRRDNRQPGRSGSCTPDSLASRASYPGSVGSERCPLNVPRIGGVSTASRISTVISIQLSATNDGMPHVFCCDCSQPLMAQSGRPKTSARLSAFECRVRRTDMLAWLRPHRS